MIVPVSKVRLRRDEDGNWIAKSNLLPGRHAYGRDRGEAILRFEQAAKAHLEALLATGLAHPARVPAPVRARGLNVPKYPTYDCRKLERRLREIGCRPVRRRGMGVP